MKTDPGGNGAPPRRRRPVIFEPLKHRDFRLLWSGMTVSLIGDGIFIVTLAWQVYELSDAPTALSLVGLAMTVPNVVFLLIGGVVSDRFDRRRVLVAADLIRGLAVGAMGLLSLSGGLELWHLMVLAAFYGAGTAFFGPAFDAIVPDLVATDLLIQANALDQFVRPAAWRLAGPAIGGFLVAWSTGGAFLVDAGTFAVSIVALLLMSPHPIDTPEGERTSALADVREGFRFVRARVWLWGTLVAAAFAYLLFIGPQEVLLPLLVKDHWGGSPLTLGFILAMGGVGAIGAALFMGQRRSPTEVHHVHVRGVDAVDARGRRLRAGPCPVAGHARVLPLQRARDGRHHRVGDHEAAARASSSCSAGCRASTGSSRSACSRSRSR